MYKRYFLIFVFNLLTYFVIGQKLKTIEIEINTIDSLLNYNKFELATTKADSLYTFIENSNFLEQKLTLLLQKACGLLGINQNTKAVQILLDVHNESQRRNFAFLTCRSSIYLSLTHEINDDFIRAYTYLKTAKDFAEKNKFEQLYSTILVRFASIHRILARRKTDFKEQNKNLQNLGFTASLDSCFNYSKRAIFYAQKYNIKRDVIDSYFLLGSYYNYQKNHRLAISYFLKEIPYFQEVGDYNGIMFTYVNISDQLTDNKNFKEALIYNDSAQHVYDKVNVPEKFFILVKRANIFNKLNQPDSAYHYMKIAYEESEKLQSVELRSEIRKLEAHYQLDNKEQTIQNRNRQLILALTLLGFILVATVINIRKNRLINRQNIIINQQVAELQKTVDQMEILLSELQHRVKNNLQYVISLLEIQKESIGHSTVEDLIRSNQNRIHSIALLHKKLNVNENVDEVELKRYLTELAELVLVSYEKDNQRVKLSVSCDLTTLTLNKAMPVGLIIVELISNSMKHAFKNVKNGQIRIDFSYNQDNKVNVLHYQDDGIGFDFDNTNIKGLGLEIIKGLIDQLDAKIETQQIQGFSLKLLFE